MVTSWGKAQYSASADSTGQHVGITERIYRRTGTARPILWCHSASADVANEPVIATNNTLALLDQITSTFHCPILSFDATGNGHWGNDAAQNSQTDALAYIRSAFGASNSLPPIIFAVSMGGLLALNWARANPTLVRALVLFYPCVNLQAQHDGTGGAAAVGPGTEAAYGGSLATFNAAVATHDPSQNEAAYTGVPIQMWYSDSDTVVGTANQSAFVTGVGGVALETHVLTGAAHGDMTRLDQIAITNFIKARV